MRVMATMTINVEEAHVKSIQVEITYCVKVIYTV